MTQKLAGIEIFQQGFVRLHGNRAESVRVKLLPADIIQTWGGYDAICLWDQPNGKGNMICLTGTGNTDLSYLFRYVEYTPQGVVYHYWDKAVRSYQANGTKGSFAGGTPVRHESFGPNYNVVNAGRIGQVATRIYVNWIGPDEWIQSGTILSDLWGNLPPGGGSLTPVCLTVFGNANGTPVQLWEPGKPQPNPWPNQKWHYDSNGGAIVHVASGKCIQVAGDGSQNGQLLELWDRTGANNQQWGFDPQLNEWYNPQAKCIDVPGGAANNGVQLQIWDRIGGNPNQIWTNYFY